MHMPKEAFENKSVKNLWLSKRYKFFQNETQTIYEVLSHKENFELIFWYTNWLDATGHLEQGFKYKTMNRYLEINTLVRKIQSFLNHTDILYIISDHGMIPAGNFGYHSDHGFFSSSTGERISKPFELHSLLRKHLKC